MDEAEILKYDSKCEVLPVADSHNHIYPDNLAEKARDNVGRFYKYPMFTCGTTAELYKVRAEEYKGRRIAVQLVSSPAITPSQTESINGFISSVCTNNNSLIGFGTIHKDNENFKDIIADIKSRGLRGIKLHPEYQKTDIDDPGLIEIYKAAAEADLPILFHMGDKTLRYSSPDKLAKVAAAVPELQIIAAHMGGYLNWEEAYKEIPVCGNVYFDISSTMAFLPKETVLKMIEKFGADKIFFGSDFPICNPIGELEKLDELGFDYADRRRIEYYNFAEFFGII